MRAGQPRGFTLMEVMLALALLGFGLVVLMRSTAGNVYSARESQMMGIVTDLSRAKMYDIEEILLKDGFQETDILEENLDFDDEGFPDIKYSYKVEQVELPSFQDLAALAQAQAGGSGSAGSGSGSAGDLEGLGGFGDSALGGMLMSMGGLGGGSGGIDAADAQGASFLQGQYELIQETLKASIRKVTLDVTYMVGSNPRELRTVAFFTDPGSMDKVLSGLGAQDLDDQPGGDPGSGAAGSGGGGSGGRGTGIRPRTPTGGVKP